MSIDFSTRTPYCNIKSMTIDGHAAVFIPALYYKVHTPVSGTYSGQKIWSISDIPKDGFTLHPAFMHNGQVQSGFYIGSYEVYKNRYVSGSVAGKSPWVNITIENAKAAALRNGSLWHLQTIYERHAIAMLMLTEYGTSDMQSAIGYGNCKSNAVVSTGTTNAVWRGIHKFWGNVDEFFDGFYTSGNAIHIFDNQGNGTYVTIKKNISISSGNGFAKVCEDKGANYDLTAVFISSDASDTSPFPDWALVNTSNELYPAASGRYYLGQYDGAFSFSCGYHKDWAGDGNNAYGGFRAARYVS